MSSVAGPVGGKRRWVRVEANLLIDTVPDLMTSIRSARKAGANGVVFADTKTNNWFGFARQDRRRWLGRVTHLRDQVHRLGMKFIVNTVPVGYCTPVLAHGPNLATGYPMRRVPLVARAGRLKPVNTARLDNGSFESHSGNRAKGWDDQDSPGQATYVDTTERKAGSASLRFQASNAESARIFGTIKVKPYQQYRLTFGRRCPTSVRGTLGRTSSPQMRPDA